MITFKKKANVSWLWGWIAKDGDLGRLYHLGDWCLVKLLDGEPHEYYHPLLGTHPAHRDTFSRWSSENLP